MYHSRLRKPAPDVSAWISRSNSVRAGGWQDPRFERGEALPGPLAQLRQGLAGRADDRLADPVHRALGRGVKGAEAVHLVAEQLDPQWAPQVWRPHVDDAAPPAELPRRLDDRRTFVAEPDPAQQHPVQVERLALTKGAHREAHLAYGQGHLHQPAGRRDGDGCDTG